MAQAIFHLILSLHRFYAIIHLKVGDMMKKYIILNMTPFLIWILWFVCILNDIFTSAMIQLGLLLCMPIIFAVINVVFAKDEKLFLIFIGVFAAAHILGYYLSGALYHSFWQK